MTKDKAIRLALEAMNLANSSHNTMLLSDPPQSAWRYHNVDMKLREAIIAIKAALEAKDEPVDLNYQPDWKEEYQKAVELHCITLDELREGMGLNRKLEKTIATQDAMLERQTARIVDLQTHIENFDREDR